MRVLALTSYPNQAAATRFRLEQFERPLAERGIFVEIAPFLHNATFRSLYDKRRLARNAAGLAAALARRTSVLFRRNVDLILVQREAMLLGPPVFEWIATANYRRPLVLDLDDATYLPYDSPTYGRMARMLKWPGKTDALIKRASVVTCGSASIADYVEQVGTRSVVLPTVVDTDRFVPSAAARQSPVPVIGWVGTHSTFKYVQRLIPALEELARTRSFVVRLVGSGMERVAIAGVRVETLPWRLENEIEDFQAIDIGIYPVADDLWGSSKSGLKAIEYMAVGTPFVASPAVPDLGCAGVTHLVARSPAEWVSGLTRLLDDPHLRDRMGVAGRDHVLRHYTVPLMAERLADVLRMVHAESNPGTPTRHRDKITSANPGRWEP